MAASLTFETMRRQRWSDNRELRMNGRQRKALSELVHGTGGPHKPRHERDSTFGRDRHPLDLVWFAVLALMFLLGSRALFEGIRFVHTADALQIIRMAEPHVDVTIERLPPADQPVFLSAPSQSSPAVKRTM